ncbi:MAG: hypothetical protein ACK4GN_12860 [Runella sp.]
MKTFTYFLSKILSWHFLLGLMLLATACQNPNQDLYEINQLKGTVQLKDDLAEAPTVIAPEATIYLAYNATADPYLLKQKADKEGKFIFTHQAKNIEGVRLVGEYKDKDGVLFRGDSLLNTFRNNDARHLILKPQYPRNQLKVTVKNSLSQAINGMDVYLFVNEDFSKAANTGSEVRNAIRTLKTNERGVAFFYNLDSDRYWVIGRLGDLRFNPTVSNFRNTTDFSGRNLDQINFIAHTPPSPATQLAVEVKDADGAQGRPTFGTEVFLFVSQEQAQTVRTMSNPTGRIARQITNADGKAFFANLTPGKTYFIGARDTLVGVNNVSEVRYGFGSTTAQNTTTPPASVTIILTR